MYVGGLAASGVAAGVVAARRFVLLSLLGKGACQAGGRLWD